MALAGELAALLEEPEAPLLVDEHLVAFKRAAGQGRTERELGQLLQLKTQNEAELLLQLCQTA